MAVLTILEEPDVRLRRTSRAVEDIDARTRDQVRDMLDTLKSRGAGLAAPQVDILKRIVVYDLAQFPESLAEIPFQDRKGEITDDTKDEKRFAVMINPEITERSQEECVREEYCLSVPQFGVKVSRAKSITVRFLDVEGSVRTQKAAGLFARCIQHEIDHLDGVLVIDYLSPLKKELTTRKLEKIKRAGI